MSAESFIKRSFCMQVAAVCSEEAELCVRQNNLTFCEMLRPFCHLSVEVPIRDPQGHHYNAKDIHVRFVEPMTEIHSDSKLRLILDSTVHWTESKIMETERKKAYSPWYDFYRDTFLENMSVSNHDLLGHFICTVFVIASDSEDPLTELEGLRGKVDLMKRKSNHSRWLPQSVDYCVVLHDSSQSDPARGASMLEQVKEKFGKHCTLLSINSVTPDGAAGGERSFLDPWFRILQRESHTGVGSLNAVIQPVHPPPSRATPVEGSSVPNGPLRPSEARGEAELVDANANGSSTPSLPVVEDPLLNLGKTNAPPNADGFGQFMSSDDHERLRKFVLDLTRQTLIPTLCEVRKALNELVQARRGGFQKMWKSLRNITSNSPAAPPLYQSDSQEAQTRLLADVSMLLQNYEHAYQLYHSLKGDFKADKAWLNYAGAMELTAVSCFMTSHKLLTSYLDEAMTFYLNHADSSHFAFRVILIHCELLKGQQKYREAAQVFLRMSSPPKGSFLASSDLRCALALEEAGNCYLLAGMTRQYCLYVFMAAHRYIKARQMVHGARALNQALGMLKGKEWSLSEVFLQTSLARHYWQCHRYHEAWKAFEMVLASADHRQSPTAQHPLFKEYVYTLKHLFGSTAQQPCLAGRWSTAASVKLTGGLPTLVVPEVLSSHTKVLFSAVETCPKCPAVRTSEGESAVAGSSDITTVEERHEDDSEGMSLSNLVCAAASKTRDPSRLSVTLDGSTISRLSSADLQRHRSLEEELAKKYNGVQRVPLNFEPCMLHLDATTTNTRRPYCIVNEPVYVEVSVKNRLQIPLQLSNVTLIWKLEPEVPGTPVDPEDAALGEVVPSVVLYHFEEKQIRLHIVPLKEGILHVTGLLYTLHSYPVSPSVPHKGAEASAVGGFLSLASHGDVGGIQGQRDLTIRGPRLHRTMVERTSVMYGTDHRLSWTIRPPAPRMKVLMENYPSWLLAGEVCQVPISFINCGWKDLQNIYLATSLPEYFTVIRGVSSATAEESSTPPSPSTYHHFDLPVGGLPPGEHHQGDVLVQAPPRHAQLTWDWLYYYVPSEEIKGMSHRIVPFTSRVDVRPSLNVTCAVHSSCVTPDSMGDSVLLTLEMENVCQVEGGRRQAANLSVYQLSCISWEGWTIAPLDTSQGVLDIIPEQCGHVVLKATQPAGGVEGMCADELKFCDLALGEEKIKCSLFPAVNLFRQSQVHKDLCDRTASEKQRKKRIALAVFWKASISLKEGVRHAHGIHFALLEACTERNAPRLQSVVPRICQESVVQWSLRHPPSVAHDFSKNRALLVPVELTLLNTSAREELSVQISLRSDATTTSATTPKHDNVPPIQWVGTTEWRVPRLKAKERMTVKRDICFTSPDVYPISTFVHVSIVRLPSGRGAQNAPPIFVPQSCPQSAVIIVTNTNL